MTNSKINIKLVMFFIITLIFLSSFIYFFRQPNKIFEVKNKRYTSNASFELEGIITQQINDTVFYVRVIGLDESVLIYLDNPLINPLNSTSIDLFGHFDSNGAFHAANYRLSYFQAIKYIISFVGFVIFLFIFFKDWKITLKGFEER